jgi:glyoxylase-like metal-dependent hydrolase (beta-lactamase superfamily II)
MPETFTMHRIMSGPYHLLTYILACTQTRECLIIDPGDRTEKLVAFLKTRDLTPTHLLLTHGHADQFFVTEEFKRVWDIPYCIHREDEAFFRDPGIRDATRKAVGLPPPYPADIELAHGDIIHFGDNSLSVIHTPGHTPGSACFLLRDHLFTGDTLFVGEAGRTDLPGGNLDQLITSIRERIMPLPAKTQIFPGHHNPGSELSTTLEREKQENIYITDFILDS